MRHSILGLQILEKCNYYCSHCITKSSLKTNYFLSHEEIKKTRASAFAIREKYKQEALKEKEQMLISVSQECRAQVNQAKKEMDEQLENLKADLQAESDILAETIKQRLLH